MTEMKLTTVGENESTFSRHIYCAKKIYTRPKDLNKIRMPKN